MELTFFVAVEGARPLAEDLSQKLGDGSAIVLIFDSRFPDEPFEYAMAATPRGLVGSSDPSNNSYTAPVEYGTAMTLIVSSTIPGLAITVLDHRPTGIESFPPPNHYNWTLGLLRHVDARPAHEPSGFVPIVQQGALHRKWVWSETVSSPGARAIAIGWTWHNGPTVEARNDTLLLQFGTDDRRIRQLDSDPLWAGASRFTFGSLSANSPANQTTFGRMLEGSTLGSGLEAGVVFLSVPLEVKPD